LNLHDLFFLVSYEGSDVLETFSHGLLENWVLAGIVFVTGEEVYELVIGNTGQTGVFSFFVFEESVELLTDAFVDSRERGQRLHGAALEDVADRWLDIDLGAQTFPSFLKELELEVLTGQLSASSRFGEYGRQQQDLILQFLPLLEKLIGSVEHLIPPTEDLSFDELDETGS
jgi:hypothetical protein